MSKATRLTAGKKATIWPLLKEDDFGRKIYGTPFVIKCTYDNGSSAGYNAMRGISFEVSVIAWAEFDGSFKQPHEGDYIGPGEQETILNPLDAIDAYPIKLSEISDCSLLREKDDIRLVA